MNKAKRGRKFGRKRDERRALLRGLAQALFLREKISTTEAKAKELKSYAEKIITKTKIDTVAARRQIAKDLPNSITLKKLFTEIGPRYKDRKGGYTRVIKRIPRRTDSAKMAIIELV